RGQRPVRPVTSQLSEDPHSGDRGAAGNRHDQGVTGQGDLGHRSQRWPYPADAEEAAAELSHSQDGTGFEGDRHSDPTPPDVHKKGSGPLHRVSLVDQNDDAGNQQASPEEPPGPADQSGPLRGGYLFSLAGPHGRRPRQRDWELDARHGVLRLTSLMPPFGTGPLSEMTAVLRAANA